jgi:hypothetical protein
MNGDIRGPNEGIPDRSDTLARYRHIERRLKRQKRRRWGARLFALSAILLLVGGFSAGVRGAYAQQQETMAIAKQRDSGTRLEAARQ